MHESNVGHPKYPTGGLKGGPPCKVFLSELLLGESLGCPTFSDW